MAIATNILVTAEEFDQVSFPEKAELIRGEIVEITNPVSDDGQIVMNVAELLAEWSPRRSKGRIIPNDSRVQTGRDPDTVRGPDLLFIANERLPPEGLTHRCLQVPPDLAVEIFSPPTAGGRFTRKWAIISLPVFAKCGSCISDGDRSRCSAPTTNRPSSPLLRNSPPTSFPVSAARWAIFSREFRM